jgi:hypothetical protein
MSEQNQSAAGLVTEPAKTAPPTPFTQPNPDPAAKLHPDKAGQRVSSPVADHGAKPKRRKRSFAKRVAKVAAASKAKDLKTESATDAAIAAEEHARAKAGEGRAAYDVAVEHAVTSYAELPEDAALSLRLANGEAFIDGAVEVERSEIVPAANGVTYGKDVDLGPGGEPLCVTEAWLIADSGEAVCCALGPLTAGNGHHAKIPAGHLKF